MPLPKLFRRSKLIKIGLRCLECGRTFTQRAECLYIDLGTLERREKGEKPPHSEFFVPARVICPRCQAEDRYDLSGWQSLRVILGMFWMRWFRPGPDSWLQAAYLGSKDGRVMHPFEMRAWYAGQVALRPDKADLRLGYANTLRSQGRFTEAEEQYRAALKLVPRQAEALINLAALLHQRGETEPALETLRLLAAIRPKNEKQREYISIAREVLDGDLPLDELEVSSPLLLRK